MANWVSAAFKTLIRTIAESTYPSIISPHIILRPKYPTTARATTTAGKPIFSRRRFLACCGFRCGDFDIPRLMDRLSVLDLTSENGENWALSLAPRQKGTGAARLPAGKSLENCAFRSSETTDSRLPWVQRTSFRAGRAVTRRSPAAFLRRTVSTVSDYADDVLWHNAARVGKIVMDYVRGILSGLAAIFIAEFAYAFGLFLRGSKATGTGAASSGSHSRLDFG